MAITAIAVAADSGCLRHTGGDVGTTGGAGDAVGATVGDGREKSGTYLPGWYAITNSPR
jgi:hypothetical protein